MRRLLILVVVMLAACSSAGGDENGDATTAEIHCETWVSQELGIPTGELQFDHQNTIDSAPSYQDRGTVVGGGRTLAYRCDTTFDGNETWTLDNLELVPV